MGKKLIIKGADFSANGVLFPININITKLITTFVDGINGVRGNENSDRKAVYPRFSIERYRQAGYSKISVNVKSLGCYPFITSIGPKGLVDNTTVINFDVSQYLSKGEYTLNFDDIDSSFIYFGLNIDKTQADISSNNLSDYIEITLS